MRQYGLTGDQLLFDRAQYEIDRSQYVLRLLQPNLKAGFFTPNLTIVYINVFLRKISLAFSHEYLSGNNTFKS